MITFKIGDLFSEFAEALVNPVNCVGVAGKGLALKFKEEYPGNFIAYRAACDCGEVKIGKMFTTVSISSRTTHIINFPTKQHWRNPSKIEYIEAGLESMVAYIRSYDIGSIFIPALGCGNGNLNWSEVKPIIVSALEPLTDVNIVIFEPFKVA